MEMTPCVLGELDVNLISSAPFERLPATLSSVEAPTIARYVFKSCPESNGNNTSDVQCHRQCDLMLLTNDLAYFRSLACYGDAIVSDGLF